jgi:hypothetical protein
MPGTVFHIELLQAYITNLENGSAEDVAKARIMRDHPAYANLGALGPDILRYRPARKAAIDTLANTTDLNTLDQNAQQALAQQIVPNPEMAPYGVAYRLLVPHFAELDAMEAFLTDLLNVVTNEDIDALIALQPQLDGLQATLANFQSLEEAAKTIYTAAGLAAIVGKPIIQSGIMQGSVHIAGFASLWLTFEYLR